MSSNIELSKEIERKVSGKTFDLSALDEVLKTGNVNQDPEKAKQIGAQLQKDGVLPTLLLDGANSPDFKNLLTGNNGQLDKTKLQDVARSGEENGHKFSETERFTAAMLIEHYQQIDKDGKPGITTKEISDWGKTQSAGDFQTMASGPSEGNKVGGNRPPETKEEYIKSALKAWENSSLKNLTDLTKLAESLWNQKPKESGNPVRKDDPGFTIEIPENAKLSNSKIHDLGPDPRKLVQIPENTTPEPPKLPKTRDLGPYPGSVGQIPEYAKPEMPTLPKTRDLGPDPRYKITDPPSPNEIRPNKTPIDADFVTITDPVQPPKDARNDRPDANGTTGDGPPEDSHSNRDRLVKIIKPETAEERSERENLTRLRELKLRADQDPNAQRRLSQMEMQIASGRILLPVDSPEYAEYRRQQGPKLRSR